jgi:hypothetical protein
MRPTSNEEAAAALTSPVSVATSSRHEVSEPIGSGRSFRSRAIATEGAERSESPLGPWPVKPRLASSPCPDARASAPRAPEGRESAPPVRGEVTRIGVSDGETSGARSRFASAERGRPEPGTVRQDRTSESAFQGGLRAGGPRHAHRGSDDRAVVLADCMDCRSRRAAPGPPPKAVGSSLSPAERRTGAGSRLAAAKL